MPKVAKQGVTDLATVRPDLAAEWNHRQNGDVTPRDVTPGSNKKAWWLCGEGHEWAASPNDRNGGNGCPYCSGRFAIVGETDLATVNPGLASEWHPQKNQDLTPSEVTSGAHRKAWWLCGEGHEWQASVKNRNGGSGCPYCSGRRAVVGETDLATVDPGLASEWHQTKNIDVTPRDVTPGSNKKAWWLCAMGHSWQAVIHSRHSGRGCPYCSGNIVLTGFNDLATLNPDVAREWNSKRNGDVTPRDVTSSSNKKAWWLCGEGHEWQASVNHRNSGRGCPGCAKGGYDQTSPGYLYLLRKEHQDLQQFGITNHPENRLTAHQRKGWELLSVMGPADGVWIVETETALGRFFQDKGFLLPRDYPDKFDGFSESWRSDELSFSTCAEMLEALRDWETKI
jgi:hypothetical protein